MHDFRCKKVSEMHHEPLTQKGRYFKENEWGRETLCKILEDLREEALKETARNLIVDTDLSIDKIAKATGLSPREVEKIKKDLNRKKSL